MRNETTNTNDRHYIADEKLGGIGREYIESVLKAKVGDYAYIELMGTIEVVHKEDFGVSGEVTFGDYKTLLPTDIVRVNGDRYWLVDRKAEIGDRILTVRYAGSTAMPGDVLDVTSVEEDGNLDAGGAYFSFSGDYDDEYIVLEPISADKHAKESSNTDPTTPDLIDMVIRLTRTVAQQQDELDSLHADLRTFAETATTADYKAGQALTTSELQVETVEMLTDDIVMLDERTMGCRRCGGHQ